MLSRRGLPAGSAKPYCCLRKVPAGATRRLVRFAPTENRRLFTAHSFFTTRAREPS